MMREGIGKHTWSLSGGYISLISNGAEPTFTSRDQVSILNVHSGSTAEIRLTVYLEDDEYLGPFHLKVPPQRVCKIRFNDLVDPLPLPLKSAFSWILHADIPVVVQFSKMDTSSENTTITGALAYGHGLDSTSELFNKHISTNTMENKIGKTTWAIAEGYIPSYGHGPEPEMTSHETACILNAGDEDATIEIFLYFADREPVGPYKVEVPARRTKHLRFNDLQEPMPVPLDTDYASVLISNVPVVVQHTRLDSRQAENALMTTIAYSD